MDMERRALLKGMALSGVAGLTLGSPMRVFAVGGDVAPEGASSGELLVLVGEDAASVAFLHGAAAAQSVAPRALRAGRELDFMLDFERRLRSGLPGRWIGLLDDASASLIVDLARSGGARVQWLGQHTASASASHHHAFGGAAEGCAQWLAAHMQSCGAAFTLTEERHGAGAPIRLVAGPPLGEEHAGQWASGVGYLLASLGTGMRAVPPAPVASEPIVGSFVSFSIEV